MSRKIFLVFFFVNVCAIILTAGNQEPGKKNAAEEVKEPETVLITGGEFFMGKDRGKDKKRDKPVYIDNDAHKVIVDSFYMDKCEVTNAQYYKFCKETGRALPKFWDMDELHSGLKYPNHPVVGVSCLDAEAYAQSRGMRLPTEAEWEYAARGGLVGKSYPNGDDLDPKEANIAKHYNGTTEVGRFKANGYGLYDMSGNVREWVADYYNKDYYKISPEKNPSGPEIGKFRVVRGGGWFSGKSCCSVYARNALKSTWLDFAVGFRCAKDAKKD